MLTSVLELRFCSCEQGLVWHSRVGEERTTARIIQGSLWVLWFTGRESPERENNSPVHPATDLTYYGRIKSLNSST